MKRITSFVFVALITISVLLMPSAKTSEARLTEPGRFVVRYSPVLGINVGLVVRIDGNLAGAFTKGHVFDRSLSPGPHRISIYRNGRGWDAYHSTLYVDAGQTYSYVAKYNVNRVILEPAAEQY